MCADTLHRHESLLAHYTTPSASCQATLDKDMRELFERHANGGEKGYAALMESAGMGTQWRWCLKRQKWWCGKDKDKGQDEIAMKLRTFSASELLKPIPHTSDLQTTGVAVNNPLSTSADGNVNMVFEGRNPSFCHPRASSSGVTVCGANVTLSIQQSVQSDFEYSFLDIR